MRWSTPTTPRWSGGRRWPTPTPRWWSTPTSAVSRSRHRHRVAADLPQGLPAGRRPRPVHRRHAVPAVVEEDGPGDQRGQRQPAAGGAGQPVRFRRLTGVAAQDPARVRRRDRPGHRQFRRPDRLLPGVALPRRCVRGVLRRAQRQHGGGRRRGLVRLGDRRRAGRSGGLHPRRQQPHRGGPADQGTGGRSSPPRTTTAAGARCGASWPSCAAPCAQRSWARWRRSSSRSTTSSGPSGSARCTPSSRPSSCVPT